MIQEIYPHIFCNDYEYRDMEDDDYVIVIKNNKVLISEDLKIPEYREIKEYLNEKSIFLFSMDGKSYFLADSKLEGSEEKIENGRYIFEEAGALRERKPSHRAFIIAVAVQLYDFYEKHKYCGKCGSKLTPGKTERSMVCNECKNVNYPVLSPSVIVAVTDGDRLLLTKYAGRSYKKYALVAGYAEVGETLEETVKREVLEEVSLKVKNVRYYKSQPWPFSGTLLAGFFAELDGDDSIKLQEDELAEAVWFKREDIPETDSDVSLTNEMIEVFRNNKNI